MTTPLIYQNDTATRKRKPMTQDALSQAASAGIRPCYPITTFHCELLFPISPLVLVPPKDCSRAAAQRLSENRSRRGLNGTGQVRVQSERGLIFGHARIQKASSVKQGTDSSYFKYFQITVTPGAHTLQRVIQILSCLIQKQSLCVTSWDGNKTKKIAQQFILKSNQIKY